MFFEKGKKYVVTSDLNNHFTPGDVVVSLENDISCAYCYRDGYDSNKSIASYDCAPLTCEEVVELNSGTDIRTLCESLILDKMRDIVNIAKMYDLTTDYLAVSFSNGMLSVNNNYWENHRMIERSEVFEDDK